MTGTPLLSLHRRALQAMSSGYNSKNLRYPTSKLTELLALDSQQNAINLCRLCGLSVVDAKVQFLKASFKGDVEVIYSRVLSRCFQNEQKSKSFCIFFLFSENVDF